MPTEMPRRSRRITKLPLEGQQHAATTVCRQLGLTDQEGSLSDDVMDKYTEFLRLTLTRWYARALSTLLGKELPPTERISVGSPAISLA